MAKRASFRTVEIANILGISRQRVNELGRMGKIRREANGGWDLDKVRARLGRTLDNSQQRQAQALPSGQSSLSNAETIGNSGNVHEIFNRARAAKEVAIAKREQLEQRRREGELLDVAEAREMWTKTLIAFKEHLLLISDKLAPKVAVCSDVLECRDIIEREIRKVLMVLSESKDEAA